MDNNFQPQSAFEGYVFGRLEEIANKFKALPCEDTEKRIRKCETELSNMQGKATVIGAAGGFIAGFLGKIFIWK